MLRDCKVNGSVRAIVQGRPAWQPEEGAPGARASPNHVSGESRLI